MAEERIQGFLGDAATTKGGCDPWAFLSNGTLKNGNIKASPGQLYGLCLANLNAAACYLRLYDKASAPATTDTPVYRVVIPGGTTGPGRVIHFPKGLKFSAGIGYRITTGVADNDDTATAANEVIMSGDYI